MLQCQAVGTPACPGSNFIGLKFCHPVKRTSTGNEICFSTRFQGGESESIFGVTNGLSRKVANCFISRFVIISVDLSEVTT